MPFGTVAEITEKPHAGNLSMLEPNGSKRRSYLTFSRQIWCLALVALCSLPCAMSTVIDGVTYHDVHHNCTNSDVTYDFHFRGANLGGWLVLEPWITPSLFYQFLGASEKWGKIAPLKVGMDSWTFCTALGAAEANAQLRKHWDAWVREEDIINLSNTGIDTVRIPVGDYMFVPYGPYPVCMDGAIDQLNRVLGLLEKHNLKAIIDIHTAKDSQNGFDNGGQAMEVIWTSTSATNPAGVATFEHWPVRSAQWIGTFDRTNNVYTSINYNNINHILRAITNIVDMYKDDPVVVGVEALNEPWEHTPLDLLKQFYWDAYMIVRKNAPHWVMLLHDSFHSTAATWEGFLKDCPSFAFDTHVYQAWMDPTEEKAYLDDACKQQTNVQEMENRVGPIIIGEFSLATDNCALWLNGFNDNLPEYPKVECEFVQCPAPYMGPDQPGAPPDPSKPAQDPFGSGVSSVVNGQCPRGKPWPNEQIFMNQLASAKLHSFDAGHGWFFWNFRTEFEPRWDFLQAYQLGYFPTDLSSLSTDPRVQNACNTTAEPTVETSTDPSVSTQADHTTLVLLVLFASLGALAGMVVVRKFSQYRPGYVSIGTPQFDLQMTQTQATNIQRMA